MQVYGAILPGAAQVARLLPRQANQVKGRSALGGLSRRARHRLKVIQWYEERGRRVRATCRYWGISTSTFYTWLRRYQQSGPAGLEERSRCPRRVRRPTWSRDLALAVYQLRERYPRWGKDKLARLLQDAGWQCSTSMVGRILTDLKKRAVLQEAPLKDPWLRPRPFRRTYATRKPRDYVATEPGDLVQVDSTDIRPFPGLVLKQITARDVVSRWDTIQVYHRATAAAAADLLNNLRTRAPYRLKAIQVDGGSEFKAEFERLCAEHGILLFVLPPRSPKLNGSVERAQRTHKEEFYHLIDWPDCIAELRRLLRAQEILYNTVRPHQSLGYLTPLAYIQQHEKQKTDRDQMVAARLLSYNANSNTERRSV